MNNISESVIRIVQDYCFEISATYLIDKFAISITPRIVKLIENEDYNPKNLIDAIRLRKDFIIANDLDIVSFSKGLYGKLNYELPFCKSETFFNSMIRFKHKIEENFYNNFPEHTTLEENLKLFLVFYIKEETFLEPEMSGGNSDICVPKEKVCIETKLWRGEQYYQAGFDELDSYLEGRMYKEGYYIIFDYTKKGCSYFNLNGGVFNTKFNSKTIHVVFIRMNPISPSLKYKSKNK